MISDDCSAPSASSAIARGGRRRRALHALALARNGSASTATSSARCGWRPPEAELRRAVRPGRPLAAREARGAARRARRRAARLLATSASSTPTGRVLRETLWRGRRNNHTDLASLLIANTITGAATLFRREVAELALPFPDAPGLQFHDHWLGARGAGRGRGGLRRPPALRLRPARAAPSSGRRCGQRPSRAPRARARSRLARRVLPRLPRRARSRRRRCWPAAARRLTRRKRRALERFVRAPSARRWRSRGSRARPLRALSGRTETLGSERELVAGILWRRLVALRARRRRGRGAPPTSVSRSTHGFDQRRLRRWRRPAARLTDYAARSRRRVATVLHGQRAPVVIEVRGLDKTFRIPRTGSTRSRSASTRPLQPRPSTASCGRCAASPSTSTRASSSGSSAATARARARC